MEVVQLALVRILVIGSMLVCVSSIMAQPVIYSIDGEISTGDTLVVSGTGFGDKTGQDSPLLWDTLSNQPGYIDRGVSHGDIIPSTEGDWDLSPCPDCPWDVNQPDWALPMKYWNEDNRVADRPHYRVVRKGFFRKHDLGDDDPKQIYLNWWFRTSAPDLSVGSNKFVRLWADNDRPEGSLSWTGMHMTYTADADHDGINDGGDGHVVDWGGWGGSSGTWHNLELIYDGRGDIEHGYGHLRLYRDGVLVNSADDAFGELPWNRLFVFGFDASVGENFDGETFDFSEIYLDASLARIVIGNAPTYSQVTHKEIQIPTSWNDEGASIIVNTGSFLPGEDLWLFAFDENGNVSSSGYPLTLPDSGPPGTPGQPSQS